jgi:NAD(P)-dependent dehydrogenase (short-subunit alcohol dehydrogenase family)
MKLQDRVAIVTGGGRGMGRVIAATLARAGASVCVADINLPSAEETAAVVTEAGGRAAAIVVDVRRAADRAGMVDRALGTFGRLDLLINNAAVIGDIPALELNEVEWDRVLDVNLKGLFFCAQAAAKAMMVSGGGVIVNFSSLSAELPEPDCVHYGASKAGVAHLTKSLAVALGRHNIRVVALAPGTIRTPMSADFLAQRGVEAERVQHIALGRIGRPDEVADAVAFLVSDDARYITGSTLYVDGGQLLLR